MAPYLFDAVNKRKRSLRTGADGLHNRARLGDIDGALPLRVIAEYIRIKPLVDTANLLPTLDRFIWRWNPTGMYTTQSA